MADDAQEPASPPEWPATLDVAGLLEQGWRPTPFHEFVVKVHSRCNLACDYCYIYEMSDQSWRAQPRRMSRPVLDRVAARIAEHARANLLPEVTVTLHGGEPLLAGADHLRYAIETIRAATAPDVAVSFNIQTNGVLLSPRFLDLFDEFAVEVGVSIDGDREGQDRHRRRADGRGSYADVEAGLDLLTSPLYEHLFGGLLCTVDLANDPVTTYKSLESWDPPGINFLLPHGNWQTRPPGRPADESAPYGDWLAAAFDAWYGAYRPGTTVRLFNEIIRLLFGQPSRSEAVGLSPVSVVVIESNGRMELVDSLKSTYEGATHTMLHVSRDPFNAALMLPAVAARQIRHRALSPQCSACRIRQVCGGGHYAHRYGPGTGFRNPSVYCQDLMRLITHVHAAVAAELPDRRP